jgi:hypothetical protein
VANGTLKIILADDERAPLPVHLVSPHGRLAVPKVRAFVDFALPRLREAFKERALACDRLAGTDRRRLRDSMSIDSRKSVCRESGIHSRPAQA